MREALPVVIVTGAPGAGKTALLNRLLAELAPNGTPAVITHRFAREFGLDIHPVVYEQVGAMLHGEMFDFGSGCVCCSPTGDLLKHMLALKRALAECDGDSADPAVRAPTHVIIETTGLADPAVFVNLLLTSTELAGSFTLATVLALVDASAAELLLPQTAREGSCAQASAKSPPAVVRRMCEQLLAADAVILTRARSADARARARQLVAFVLASGGVSADGVPSAPILDDGPELGWAQVLAFGNRHSALLRGEGEACALPVSGPVSVGAGVGGHDGSFESACLVEDGWLHEHTLHAWAEQTLAIACAEGPGSLLRIKGVLSVSRSAPGAAAAADCELICAEWSAGCGSALELMPLPHTARREPGHVPARPLAHTMTAGMDVQPGSCKVLFVGVRLPVNRLRAALWQAMAPPGFGLAAEIEIDFPAAHRQASAELRARHAPAAAADGAEGGEGVQWAALRLASWLGPGRDALLFWLDGAFCALADGAHTGGECAGWDLATGTVIRQTGADGRERFLAVPAHPSGPHCGAIDLATGRRVRSVAHSTGAVGEGEAEGPLLCRKLELAILGGSIYVSRDDPNER